jgi:outer membrane protein assembly factor BamB
VTSENDDYICRGLTAPCARVAPALRPVSRIVPLVLLAGLVAHCGGRRLPVPSLFPMTVAWRVSLPETAEGPLATDGERIFAATRDGSVQALDRLTGAVVWQTRKQPGWLGYGSGLLALREADGTVWGLDPQTGSARWKVQSGIPGDLPPVIYKDAILVAGQGLASLRVDSGASVWSIQEPRLTVPPVPSGPWIFVGEAGGTLRSRDSATGRPVWGFPTAQALRAEPAVDDRQSVLLGTADRRFVALDTEKGDERWTWKLGADVAHPPAILGGKVLFSTYEDVLYALDRGNGHLAWRAPLPSRPLSGPLLYGSGVLVACHGSLPGETFLLGFDGTTGRRQGDLKSPGEIAAAPLLLGDRVYLALREKAVAALALGTAPPAPPPSPSPAPSPSPSR